MLFDFFKKKPPKDQYLEGVASILHSNMTPMMQMPQAYSLAAECLGDLKGMITKGAFFDGPNPREAVMAYFCLCSMVNEARSSDDKIMVLAVSTMAQLMTDEFKDQSNFTSLEKGICQFGKEVLAEGIPMHSGEDVTAVKLSTVSIIMELLREQGTLVLRSDINQLVENVSAMVGEREVVKVGDKVLALSSLTNVTGYSIDQRDIKMANVYFQCVAAATEKYVKGQEKSFNKHQMGAIRTIMKSYMPVVQELQAAAKAAS